MEEAAEAEVPNSCLLEFESLGQGHGKGRDVYGMDVRVWISVAPVDEYLQGDLPGCNYPLDHFRGLLCHGHLVLRERPLEIGEQVLELA